MYPIKYIYTVINDYAYRLGKNKFEKIIFNQKSFLIFILKNQSEQIVIIRFQINHFRTIYNYLFLNRNEIYVNFAILYRFRLILIFQFPTDRTF